MNQIAMNYRLRLFIRFALIFICGFIFTSSISAKASSVDCNSIQEIIRQDTIWTVENSPYVLQGMIQVDFGSTLTIAPGVRIVGNECAIQLWGNFVAVGTQNLKIEIENVNIRRREIDQWKPQDGYKSIEIAYARLHRAIITTTQGGTVSLLNSYLENSTVYISHYLSSLSTVPESNSYIEKNIFKQSRISISYEVPGRLRITDNSFYLSGIGISYIRLPIIDDGGEVIINYNNFFNNGLTISLEPTVRRDVDATQNYWNTTDGSQIQDKIRDRNTDLECLAFVTYSPYLVTQNENAPLVREVFFPLVLHKS